MLIFLVVIMKVNSLREVFQIEVYIDILIKIQNNFVVFLINKEEENKKIVLKDKKEVLFRNFIQILEKMFYHFYDKIV